MIRVTGTGGSGATRGARGTDGARKSSSGSFKLGEAAGAPPSAASPGASETASTSALGALIALQGEQRGRGARHRAMAERMLILLERLRDGLLSGRIGVRELEALQDAASAKLDDPDERIAQLYAEIALRARVELAKLGR